MVKKKSNVDPDLELIDRIRNGDGSGLDLLMDRHAQNLNRFIFRYTNNSEDAADLTQETFVRVFQKAGKYKPKATVKTWIYTIALNLCRDRARRATLVKWVPFLKAGDQDEDRLGVQDIVASTQESPSDSVSRTELQNAMTRGIEALADSIKIPFIMCVFDGLSHAEIALILKLSTKSVELRVYRARKQLRKSLGPFL